ncbi:hypothetical protein CKOHBEJN_02297 [Aeromonas hydrophila]
MPALPTPELEWLRTFSAEYPTLYWVVFWVLLALWFHAYSKMR